MKGDEYGDGMPEIGPLVGVGILTDENLTLPDGEAGTDTTGESWRPKDLTATIARCRNGTLTTPEPRWGRRSDGETVMIYPGKYHALNGESEAGKTWLAMAIANEAAEAGDRVVWVDAEDHEETFVMRWQAVGGDLERLRPAGNVAYVCPDEGFKREPWRETIEAAGLVILDTINAMMSADGLDPSALLDFSGWHESVCKAALDGGAAILALDHVPKARHVGKDRTGFGTVAKLNVITGAAFMLESVTPPARGREGSDGRAGYSKLRITKDRPGGIRGYAIGDRLADIRLTPGDSAYGLAFGSLAVSIDEPENSTDDKGRHRPTCLMGRASKTLAAHGGPMTKTECRDATTGNNTHVSTAIDRLIDEGYARLTGEKVRGGGLLIEHVKLFTDDE